MAQIGDRVGAILKANETTVHLLGFGVYDGDVQPPEEILPFPIPNPKITLDDGRVVWGCQCWWGSEDRVRAMIGDREVIAATINAATTRSFDEPTT